NVFEALRDGAFDVQELLNAQQAKMLEELTSITNDGERTQACRRAGIVCQLLAIAWDAEARSKNPAQACRDERSMLEAVAEIEDIRSQTRLWQPFPLPDPTDIFKHLRLGSPGCKE